MAGNPWDTRAFEQMSRQYWQAWGEMLRAAPSAPRPDPWTDAMAEWTQAASAGLPGASDAMQRFGAQAQGWWRQMQQLAAQFAGRPSSPADLAQAWRASFDGRGGNPFADMLGSMSGPGAASFDDWQRAAAPWMQASGQDARGWLRLPAFGFAREHQERWQAFAAAQLEAQEATQRYHAVLMQASREAFSKFESRLAAHEEPGRQLTSARALYDTWVDAAEETWAELALSPEYRHAYAEQANTQMRLRAALQQQLEQLCIALGLPSRTEVDSAHRKIAELERALRRQAREAAHAPASHGPDPAPAPTPAKKAAASPKRPAKAVGQAPKKTGGKSGKPADRQTTRKPVAKKRVSRATVQGIPMPAAVKRIAKGARR